MCHIQTSQKVLDQLTGVLDFEPVKIATLILLMVGVGTFNLEVFGNVPSTMKRGTQS